MNGHEMLAMKAPITFEVACKAWGDDPNFCDDTTRKCFFAVWALLCFEWAEAMVEHEQSLKVPSGAQPAPSVSKWVLTKDKPHPDKPGLESYEHVPCLIVKSGEIMLRQWNCEHLVWDTEDGDDFYCSARDVTHWMPIQTPPSAQENNDG